MTENNIQYLYYHFNYLGVPARCASPSGFPLIVLGMLRKTRMPAGYPLQSLTRSNSYSYCLPYMVVPN